jgi:hypothetical protein
MIATVMTSAECKVQSAEEGLNVELGTWNVELRGK